MLDMKHCRKPWVEAYVHVNGDVKPCCHSYGTLGNIVDVGSLGEIIDGPAMAEVKSFIRMNRIHPICSGSPCVYVYGRIASSADTDAAEVWKSSAADIPPLMDDDDLSVSRSLRDAARIGNRDAMFHVGLELFQKDRADEALAWFEAGSRRRSEVSDHMLGAIYWYGNKAPRDPAKGLRHYTLAAEAGYAKANTMLGVLALEGFGAGPLAHFLKAGELGDPEGWFRASELHRFGRGGVNKNVVEADRLLKIAANRGHPGAIESVGEGRADF